MSFPERKCATRSFGALLAAGSVPFAASAALPAVKPLDALPGSRPRNIVLILTDDHRYDAMGFMNHPFLKTPNLDALARDGAHLRNAFVTTALCSPSRASILTGQYAHRHRVVDNNTPIPPDLVFFPQYLQQAGYATAFIGKWHMGNASDDPQPGFDRWVSFRGQGTYYPTRSGLNVDGNRVPQKGYITDELTDYALDWLKSRPKEKPFFLYLSHKAVHSGFEPPERYRGRYKDQPLPHTPTFDLDAENDGKPMWAKNQRNSHHGVEFPYLEFGGEEVVADRYRKYCETLLAVDDSVGRVVTHLREKNLLDNTVILYMGDNGFMWGEHGLIDKRAAYEPSMRVPMLMQSTGQVPAGSVVEGMVANIDVAPTLLEAAGLKAPETMDGRSFLSIARGEKVSWRDALLYEYYWERAYPQTPTCFAMRTDRYKYVLYHGIWDTDELFDLQDDPHEAKNLIRDPAHEERMRTMRVRLYRTLQETGGMYIPLAADPLFSAVERNAKGSPAAEFPKAMRKQPPETEE